MGLKRGTAELPEYVVSDTDRGETERGEGARRGRNASRLPFRNFAVQTVIVFVHEGFGREPGNAGHWTRSARPMARSGSP
jgi:hypothetical protein